MAKADVQERLLVFYDDRFSTTTTLRSATLS